MTAKTKSDIDHKETRRMATELQDYVGPLRMSDWEVIFIEDMSTTVRFTEKQADKVKDIWNAVFD